MSSAPHLLLFSNLSLPWPPVHCARDRAVPQVPCWVISLLLAGFTLEIGIVNTAQRRSGACSPSHLSSPEPHPKSGVRRGLCSSQRCLASCAAHWVQDRRPPPNQTSPVCLYEALGESHPPVYSAFSMRLLCHVTLLYIPRLINGNKNSLCVVA